MKALDLSIKDIKVGDTATCSRIWTEEDIVSFSKLSGDENPLHMDISYAENTRFKNRIVHGMLVSSLCSQIVGMYLPGKRCLYLQQNLKFKNPVFIGDNVSATGTVISKSESTGIISVSIIMKKNDSIVIEGEAVVQII